MIRNWNKQDDWFWEGNVQARVVSFLHSEGYQVNSSDTLSKQRGPDIVAIKGDKRIFFEVKGWPSDKYADGINAGKKKKTNPKTQAPHWFGSAVLTLIEAKEVFSCYSFVLVLPDFPLYRKLEKTTKGAFDMLGFEIWFVNAQDEVLTPSSQEAQHRILSEHLDYKVQETSRDPLFQFPPNVHIRKSRKESCDLFIGSLEGGKLILTFYQTNGSVFFINSPQARETKVSWQEWISQKTSPYPRQKVENSTPEGEAVRKRFHTALEPKDYQKEFVKKINREHTRDISELLWKTLLQLKIDGWRRIMNNVTLTPLEKAQSRTWTLEEWEAFENDFPAERDLRTGFHIFSREIPVKA